MATRVANAESGGRAAYLILSEKPAALEAILPPAWRVYLRS